MQRLVARGSFDQPLGPISFDWSVPEHQNSRIQRDGRFRSPMDLLPAEAQTAHVRVWSRTGNTSACVILAASRDEGYKTRERVFGDLVSRGIDLYLLENPFYGLRRTSSSASLATFSDHVLMNLASVWEARALLSYLRSFYSRLAIAGYSMGGHMAALTAATSLFPIACAALATGASAAPIYTKGLLSWSVNLNALAGQKSLRPAAKERLRLLIEAADLTRQPPPIRTDTAILVGCTGDGYVLPRQVERLHEHWPGSILRWLRAGHVTGLFFFKAALRDAVADATSKL